MCNCSIVQGYQVPRDLSNGVVITKSMKDVMVLHEFGITAFAHQSETGSPDFGAKDISDLVQLRGKAEVDKFISLWYGTYRGDYNPGVHHPCEDEQPTPPNVLHSEG